MTKNALSGEMKRDQYSLRSGLVKEYSSDRYYRQNFQLQRWQAEHQQHEAVEKALARGLPKFSAQKNLPKFERFSIFMIEILTIKKQNAPTNQLIC